MANKVLLHQIQLYKDGVFIIITAFVFYKILHKGVEALRNKNLELQENYDKVTIANREIFSLNLGLEKSTGQISNLIKSLETLIELISEISGLDLNDEHKFLSKLLHTVVQIIPEADFGSIYVFKENKIKFVDAIGYDISKLNQLAINEEFLEQTGNEVIIVEQLEQYAGKQTDKKGIINRNQTTKRTKQILLFGLRDDKDKKIAGITLGIAKDSKESFTEKSIRMMKAFKSLASAFYTINKYSSIQSKFQSEVVLSLLQLLEIHDFYTRGHSQNVALLTREIAREMDLPEEAVRDAYWAGLVHDIGKTLIPDSILNKKGSLSRNEFDEIQKHPVWGYQILKNSQELKQLAKYILYHHERCDGSGYPNGLTEDEIPIVSKIITVADGWDAMRSKRAYRDALSYEAAMREIRDNCGTQFSPDVANALMSVLKKNQI